MSNPARPASEKLMKQLSQAQSDRQYHEGRYRDIQSHISPTRGYLKKDTDRRYQDVSDNYIINNTATQASRVLAAGMMAGITSPARPWFRLTTSDPKLNEQENVKTYLHMVEKTIREVLSRSNFYNAAQSFYRELGDFGTAVMLILEDIDTVIRCVTFTVGEYYVMNDETGQGFTLIRETQYTVEQLVKFFGDEVSENVKNQYKQGNYNHRVDVIHTISGNPDRDITKSDTLNMNFIQSYVERTSGGGHAMGKSGFRTKPMMITRWDVRSHIDAYGTDCPAILCLGDVKMLQSQEKTKAEGIAFNFRPPLRASPQLKHKRKSVVPSGITYADPVNAMGKPSIEALYTVKAPVNELVYDIQETQRRINESYFKDLFLMLSSMDRSNITAREVEERHEEKLLMLGPVLERIDDEFLDPAIDRIFDICQDMGILPEPPQALDNRPLKVEYISILAQAQQAVSTAGIERVVGFASNVVAVKQDVIDKIDLDQVIDEYAGMVGVPPSIIRSDAKVAEIREQRQQQMAQQQAMESAPAMSQSLKNTAEAMDTSEVIGEMLGGSL